MNKEINVMQVLRTPPLGKLEVVVSGKRYQSIATISDGNLKRLILAAVGELVSFSGGYQQLVDLGFAPALASAPAAVKKAPSQTREQAEFLASLEAETQALREAPPPAPKPSLLNSMRAKPKPAPASIEEEPPSIVMQIDAILQKHVQSTPEIADRSVHLEHDSEGVIQIQVDGEIYRKPAEIGDPTIQICIKNALREWNSK